jgi:hypothetical protein
VVEAESSIGPAIAALAVIVFALLFAGRRTAAIWTGERPIENFVPGWWLWGSTSWRGLVRASASFYVCTILLAVSLAFAVGHNALHRGSSLLEWLGRASLIAFITGLFVSVTVAIFNRPRTLVPPRLRDGGC